MPKNAATGRGHSGINVLILWGAVVQHGFPTQRWLTRGVRKYPQMGDLSCRSALTVHRGTTHGSMAPRPVLVLGVDAPGAGHDKLHDLMVTKAYYGALPPVVRDHLICRVVDKLTPVTQKHDIEGLAMG
jgi:hypothetical protein